MTTNQLIAATAEDRDAKCEALAMGLIATKPLSVARLAQLCALGERMIQAALRKADAERDLLDTTVHTPRRVDILLPA
ncbi:MAG TPA: hypothetical protein VLI46_15585 [Ramlibacter sp.]|nr:hypothetical protein [Ramlibacter sp.]